MGNIFQFGIKILATTVKAVIASLTISAPAPIAQPISFAATPPPAVEFKMIPIECQPGDRCFETSEGKVFIFRDARNILP